MANQRSCKPVKTNLIKLIG